MTTPFRLLVVLAAAMWSTAAVGVPAQGAPAYAVTLSADRTTLEVDEYAVLTTTASQDLTGTRYTTYLYDQSDPAWYRTCKTRTCSFPVTQTIPGAHSYIAYIARDRPDPQYPPMQIRATSNTVSVSWTPSTMAVTLSTDRAWLPPGATSTLTAEATKPVDGLPVAIQVYDIASGERLAICDTGTTCSVPVVQLAPTSRTYRAFVAGPSATHPPPDIRASSNVVIVTWSVLPDPTRPPNVGGGPVTGAVTFVDSTGVPPGGAPCASTSFVFDGSSESAWVNGSGTAYAGRLSITANGGSDCETATTGAGDITVWASGTSAVGRLECGPLAGTFTRVLTDVTVTVNGDCVINDFPAIRIAFVAKGEFVPTTPGEGLTSPVTAALFAGAFAVLPT